MSELEYEAKMEQNVINRILRNLREAAEKLGTEANEAYTAYRNVRQDPARLIEDCILYHRVWSRASAKETAMRAAIEMTEHEANRPYAEDDMVPINGEATVAELDKQSWRKLALANACDCGKSDCDQCGDPFRDE